MAQAWPYLPFSFIIAFLCFIIERDREDGMGARGADMQRRITGGTRTRLAEIRTEPIC